MSNLTVSSAVDTFMGSATLAEMQTNIGWGTLGTAAFTAASAYVPAASLTGGGVLATGGFTLTVPATGTASLLGTAQTYSAAKTFSANGAANTPAVSITGTPYSGGTSTTTKPLLMLECGSPTSNAWGTSGTLLGCNVSTAIGAGGLFNFLDVQINGVSFCKIDQNNFTFTKACQFNSINFGNGNGTISNGGTFSSNYILSNSGVLDIYGGSSRRVSVYGLTTDASNYRRLDITGNSSGVFAIAPAGAGTGASGNVLHLSGFPTSNPGPGILWNNAGAPAIGT